MPLALTSLFTDPDVTFLFNDWTPVIRVVFIAFAGYIVLEGNGQLAVITADGAGDGSAISDEFVRGTGSD